MFNIIAFSEPNYMGYTSAMFVVVIYAFILGLIIISLLRLVRYLKTAGNEQKLIRMELSKLADELERMRKKSESSEDS